MIQLGNRRKIIVREKKRLILVITGIFVLVCFGVFINSKSNNHKIVVNTNINTAKDNQPKTVVDANMNLRESKVTSEEPSTDSSTTNIYKADGHKIAYLTFDDGPSAKTTPGILKVLDSYNIKATFFIIGSMAEKDPGLVKLEANDGQAIGNHTYSHNYKYIYADTNVFIEDIKKCDAVLKSILGNDFNSKVVRFPGGSFGAKLSAFRNALSKSGYHYIDWNDITGDADGQNIPVSKLLSNLKKYTKGKEHVVILMHDAANKETTVSALPQVIEYLKGQGYSFNTIK